MFCAKICFTAKHLDPLKMEASILNYNNFNTVNLEIFARILFSRIELKDKFSMPINSSLWYVLPLSVDDRVISLFLEGFIFTKLKPSRKFSNLQYAAKYSQKGFYSLDPQKSQ